MVSAPGIGVFAFACNHERSSASSLTLVTDPSLVKDELVPNAAGSRHLRDREPIKTFSKRLGHASVTITLAVYGPAIPGDQSVPATAWLRSARGRDHCDR